MKRPLPIDEHLPAAVRLLRESPRLVVKAPPGAGKTTRLPAALVDAGLAGPRDEILVLEPRRIAARVAAQRVAEERGSRVGDEVGYQVRFEEAASSRTRLRFVTEGILVRRLQRDPELRGVGAVVFDEFHERSLDADLSLALVREAQEALRPDLRVVVMSATLDPEPIAHYLGDCPLLVSEGREHPIAIEHLPRASTQSAESMAAQSLDRLIQQGLVGSVLVFMPGAAEIRRTIDAIAPLAAAHDLDVRPLHGDLSPAEQQAAITIGARHRVIVATNVAEASITVEGVVAVIDSGLARVRRYDPWSGLDRIDVERISRSSAIQRAGRAGRLGPGRCVRLYTETEFAAMPEHDEPEVRRVDLTEATLHLLAWGAGDPRAFPWLTPPEPPATDRALRLLRDLGAVSGEPPTLTEIGREMLRFPVHPRHARMLVEAANRGCFREAALLAALAGERDIRLEARAFGRTGPRRTTTLHAASDLVEAADAFAEAERARFSPAALDRLGIDARAARRVALAAAQLRRLGPRRDASGDPRDLLRCIAAGHPDRVVLRRAPRASEGVMVGGTGVRLDSSSVVREGELFVALDAALASDFGGRHVRVRSASAVEVEWLRDLFPHAFRTSDVIRFDETSERLVAERTTTFLDLPLDARETGSVDPEVAASALFDAASKRLDRAIASTRDLDDLVARVESLRRWRPDLALPDVKGEVVLEALRALCSGRRSFAELRKAPLFEMVMCLLPRDARASLDRYTPTRLTLPSGRSARVEYRPGEAPFVASRLQDFFGLKETPRVAGGAVPVVLHLLAPNQRPVQVTSDLASFWANVYPKVRSELRRRYPKHAWPEDPLA
ncbi:MAG: ATP-dependent helicase HrpB [Planctomycetes bacterium]|nr:ATP-dependent helicase HrpB [Planctomycetota bacterium]MBI3844412.1 ATP-dependent helicase HrpB [Planctomycetota bacterium]